jgi:hypothetical protein
MSGDTNVDETGRDENGAMSAENDGLVSELCGLLTKFELILLP